MLTDKELKLRRRTVGSSDVPAIVGISAYGDTDGDVIAKKLGLAGVQDPASDRRLRLGHVLEKPIAEAALANGDLGVCALVGGRTVVRDGWRSATPDFYGLITGNESVHKGKHVFKPEDALLIEVKNVGHTMIEHWQGGVPRYVLAQVQWQLDVLRHPRAKVVALLGGTGPFVWDVERDDKWIAKLVRKCRRFWEENLQEENLARAAARAYLSQLPQVRRAAYIARDAAKRARKKEAA